MTDRLRIVYEALALLGTPYWWGGNDPKKDPGLDCSGFYLYVLRQVGLTLPDMTADALYRKLAPVAIPEPGDVAFYGTREKVTHVVIVLVHGGRAIIGANGGGSKRANESGLAYQQRMARQQASVRIEDHRKGGAEYRSDLVGYGQMPYGPIG